MSDAETELRALYRGRPDLTGAKQEYAELTNPRGLQCSADEALEVLGGRDAIADLDLEQVVARVVVCREAQALPVAEVRVEIDQARNQVQAAEIDPPVGRTDVLANM